MKTLSEHDKSVLIRRAAREMRKSEAVGSATYRVMTELQALEDRSLAIMYDALQAAYLPTT